MLLAVHTSQFHYANTSITIQSNGKYIETLMWIALQLPRFPPPHWSSHITVQNTPH